MKDPQAFCDTLKKYNLKLKGIGPLTYNLGCGNTRDEDPTLVTDPKTYVARFLSPMKK